MKQFLYGRLHAQSQGYDFYIRPKGKIGGLLDAINDDAIGDSKRLLFLQSRGGQITFGVREQLTLLDEFDRKRCNFMGYQLEDGEGPEAVPSFAAISEKFSEITARAHDCHNKLDQDSSCGSTLREASLTFSRAALQPGNGWDEAVAEIRQNPQMPLLMMFDERGNKLHLSVKPDAGPAAKTTDASAAMAEPPPIQRKARPLADPHGLGTRVAYTSPPKTSSAEDIPITYSPPPARDKDGFLGLGIGRRISGLFRSVTGKGKPKPMPKPPLKDEPPSPTNILG